MALTGTSSWSTSTDTVTGSFTGTVGKESVSGTYAGHLTLGTSVSCTFMSAIQCWLDISGSLTFTFSGKDGSFTATVEPGGRAGWGGLARHREDDFFVDLNVASGTRSYAPARGHFSLSYSSLTEYDLLGQVDQHDNGTLQGSVG